MINVVIMGGGTGQSVILRGLKEIEGIHLSTIVTVADDGGSTGRLREEFNIPAMGDIRNVMVSLAESETLLSQIMDYRFDHLAESSLAGHNLGNLIITALTKATGDFMGAISSVSKVLNVRGDIIPSSTQIITLLARMEDGTIVRGESMIPSFKNHIEEVFYDVEVEATDQAIEAIQKADVIVYGIGSLYTSILPNVIIPKIRNALKRSQAKKIYYCNVMSQPGETEGYSGEDHVNAIIKHTSDHLDLVVISNETIPRPLVERYQEQGSHPIVFAQSNHPYPILPLNLLSFSGNVIRHDSQKIKETFSDILEVLKCPLAAK